MWIDFLFIVYISLNKNQIYYQEMIDLTLPDVFYSILSPFSVQNLTIGDATYATAMDYLKPATHGAGNRTDLITYLDRLKAQGKLFTATFSPLDFFESKYSRGVPLKYADDMVEQYIAKSGVDLEEERKDYIYRWIGIHIIHRTGNKGETPKQYLERLDAPTLERIHAEYPKIMYHTPLTLLRDMESAIPPRAMTILAKILVWITHADIQRKGFDLMLAAVADAGDFTLTSGDAVIDKTWVDYLKTRREKRAPAPKTVDGFKRAVFNKFIESRTAILSSAMFRLSNVLETEVGLDAIQMLYYGRVIPQEPEFNDELWARFVTAQTRLWAHKPTPKLAIRNVDSAITKFLQRLGITAPANIDGLRGIVLGLHENVSPSIAGIRLKDEHLLGVLSLFSQLEWSEN